MAFPNYIICTAPRTGSSLLCEALAVTGVAGTPMEYFDMEETTERHWVTKLGIRDDAEYVDKVIAAASTSNGVCGLKLHWTQIDVFGSKLAMSLGDRVANAEGTPLPELIRAKFGDTKYIWLRRRNKVAQAISFYRASYTDVWWMVEGKDATPPRTQPVTRQQRAPAFNFAEIDRFVQWCKEFDLEWEMFFRHHGLAPLILVYEEFIKTYEPTTRAVMRFLGIPEPSEPLPQPRLERQSDATSIEWERRYRAMRRPAAASGANRDSRATIVPARWLGSDRPPGLFYFICAGPGAGGGLLASGLAATGLAGQPAGSLGHDAGRAATVDELRQAVTAATTPNGVCGLRLPWRRTAMLRGALRDAVRTVDPVCPDAPLVDLLRIAFGAPRFVWLRHRNKVAQAIAFHRMLRGQAQPATSSQPATAPATPDADFDFAAILRLVRLCEDVDRAWEAALRRIWLQPLMIVYEDLIEEYETMIRGTLQFIGLSHAQLEIAVPSIMPRADPIAHAWEQRFRAEAGKLRSAAGDRVPQS